MTWHAAAIVLLTVYVSRWQPLYGQLNSRIVRTLISEVRLIRLSTLAACARSKQTATMRTRIAQFISSTVSPERRKRPVAINNKITLSVTFCFLSHSVASCTRVAVMFRRVYTSSYDLVERSEHAAALTLERCCFVRITLLFLLTMRWTRQ